MRKQLLTVITIFLLLPAISAAQAINIGAGGTDQTWIGPEPNAAAGAWLDQGAVSPGDDRRDLIIGAPGTTGVLGRVYVLFGGPLPLGINNLTNAHTIITGPFVGDRFGYSTAVGNIVNTEGSIPRSLVVGAPNSGAGDAGKVYLFRGGFAGGSSLNVSNALLAIHGRPGDRLGTSLATGDINGDGFREIIIGAPGNNRVYVINGSAALNHSGPTQVLDLNTTAPNMTITAPGIGSVLTAGPLLGNDALYEIVIGVPASNAVVVIKGRNIGGGAPAFPSTWNLATMPGDITFIGSTTGDLVGSSVRVADIDGDSQRDLIMGAPEADGPGESRPGAGEVYAFLGTQLGGLSGFVSVDNAAVRFYGAAAGHKTGTSFTAGDINRDFPNDLVMYSPNATAAGTWFVYYGRSVGEMGTSVGGVRVIDLAASGQFDRQINGDPTQGPASVAQVFEVTGEGARDIAIGVPTAEGGAGAVHFTISPKMRLSSESVSVDLIVNSGQNFSRQIRVQNSSTVAITWAASSTDPWLSASPAAGAAVDTNDGVFNLIASAANLSAGTYTGKMRVTSTSRDLEMFLEVNVTMRVAPANRDPGDFSGDGMFDIIWQHGTQGWLAVWRMNGTTLIGGDSITPDRVADTNWKIVGTGDFNNDGHPDLLWHHLTSGTIAAWLMNGSHQVAGVAISPDRVADTNWRPVATGDFNGDGKRDILWQHLTNRTLSVWLMNGTFLMDGRTLTPSTVATTDWLIVGTGDFNADGKTDIVWQNQVNGLLSVWYMNGSTMIGGEALTPGQVPDSNWKIRAVGDLNADGRPDLLWQHQGNGNLAVWFMNGSRQISGAAFGPGTVPDLNWKIVGPK